MPPLVLFLARNLRATVLVAALLLFAGGFAALRMRREVEPAVRVPFAAVTASLPGSTAGELLNAVTVPVEELLRRTPGVVDFDSRTADGFCFFTVRLDEGGNALEIRERLRGKLSELRDTLAAGIVGLNGPRLDDSFTTTYDLVAGLAAPGGDLQKLRAALPALTRELSAIPAVESVEITGLPAEQIVVEYRDAELADAGFSPAFLSGLLRAQSVVAPGGYLDDKKTVAPLHLNGRVGSLDELRTVGVLDPVTGRATTLDRLLTIRAEPRTPPAPSVSVAGQPGVQIAVARRAGTDLREFSTQVRARLADAAANAGLPKPAVLIDASEFVGREYRGFAVGLFVSAVVILVLLVGAMGWRAGGLVALMVPLVLLSTLAVLQFAGYKLNLVVLAALTVASGVIADNHLVVVQFISRRLRRGDRRDAALGEAFRVLSGPLLAATLTAVAGFLPVVLTHEAASEYVADLAPVVAIALGLSYGFAFALTPFLCRASDAAAPFVHRIEERYGRMLGAALRHPVPVLAFAAGVAVVGVGLLKARPVTFFPANQSTTLAVELLRPAGSSQSLVEGDAAAVGVSVTRTLQETGFADAPWMTLCGTDLPRTSATALASPPTPNFAVALVSLPSPAALATFRDRLGKNLAPSGKDVFLRLREIAGGPQALWPIRIRLRGLTDADALAKAAAAAQNNLAADPSLTGLHAESGAGISKWTLTLKRQAAADKAVTPADIATAMNATLNGLPGFDLREGELSTPVIVRAKGTSADPIESLKDAYIYPAKGRPCLLSDVAEVTAFTEPANFERRHGVPVVTFLADAAPGVNPYEAETAAVAGLRKKLTFPGVTVASAGLADASGTADRALRAEFPLALAVVALVLLAQTRSWRVSLLVLAAVPFGVAGAGFGLTLAGLPMGFMPLIGLTAMAGIVVNIAVVMAASLGERRAAEETADASVVEAARDRVEPIVLSALCTLGGTVPLYLFGGPLWRSMAVTLASGLVVATGFLVAVLPVVYRWLRPTRSGDA